MNLDINTYEFALYVKESINGEGIFCGNEINKRDYIFEVKGNLIRVEELMTHDIFSSISTNSYRFSKTHYLSPKGKIGDFLNHSCEPNSYVSKEGEKLFIRALKSIHKQEEILIDYSTIMADDDPWFMDCNCGSNLCRGVVVKFSSLPLDLQVKYRKLGIVPDFI